MKPMVSVLLSLVLLAAYSAFGKDAPKANPYDQVLASTPSAELPAKAVELVLQAKTRERQTVTVNAVKSAVGLNPAAAPAIVGAIARVVPDLASVAAAAAAAEQPKQASAIAKAAAVAAPAQAGRIVAAVCRAVPNEYRSIALAVSQVVPNASKEILSAVASVLPDLKPAVDQALRNYGGSVVSVADTLDQAARVAQAGSGAGTPSSSAVSTPTAPVLAVGGPLARGPVVGPPYFPPTTTPTNVTSGTSGEVPPGGRNYAAP